MNVCLQICIRTAPASIGTAQDRYPFSTCLVKGQDMFGKSERLGMSP